MNKFVFILLIFGYGCWEKDVTITSDYIINPNWNVNDNSLQITRMELKESHSLVNIDSLSPIEIRMTLKEDTSFSYIANVTWNGRGYEDRRVYYNKDNGFLWWTNNYKESTAILGELELRNWYLIAGLSKYKTLYYVYIDSIGSLHSYKIQASDWTNF